MWVIGHTATAYAVIRLVHVLTKREFEPRLMVPIFIFANIIDATHFGSYRILLHNPLGTFCFVALWLLIFEKLDLIDRKHFPLLSVATATHVMTDILLSEYNLLYPFSAVSFSVYGINSYEQLLAGSVITLIFVLVFILSGDYSALEMKLNRKINLDELITPRSLTFYLFIAFYLFTVAQFIFFLQLFHGVLLQQAWYIDGFFIAFSLFTLVLTALLFNLSSYLKKLFQLFH